MRPLGKNQLKRLLGLASPSSLLVVASDSVSQSLLRRGLTKTAIGNDPNAWMQITPAGMRAFADAFEAGHLEQFFNWPKPSTRAEAS